MTVLFNKGFTLIELLVVVFIIGVLAAVALPQYKLSVCKARMTQVETVLSHIFDAEKVFLTANGTVTMDFEEAGVILPGYEQYVSSDGFGLRKGAYTFSSTLGGGVPRVNGRYKGVCDVDLYMYIAPGRTSSVPGHCVSYDEPGHKYCLSRWPGSTCKAGNTSRQIICTVKQ